MDGWMNGWSVEIKKRVLELSIDGKTFFDIENGSLRFVCVSVF